VISNIKTVVQKQILRLLTQIHKREITGCTSLHAEKRSTHQIYCSSLEISFEK